MPARFKAAVASLGSASLFFTTFIVGLVFPFLEELIGQYSFLIFAGFSVASVFYVKFCCVETRGRTVEQVMYDFEAKLK